MRRFVERVSRFLADWGFPPMAARVLVTLMAAEERALTAADLAERLGVSPAAISGGVRYLMHLGMVAREPVPGSRRDLYRLYDEAWWEVASTKSGLYKDLVDMMNEGLDALGGEETHAGHTLAEMRDYFAFLEKELPLLRDKWRASRGRAT
ncbi:GbsR/MarR family transcriptional regulator [Bailinhaonella thermotolerans]|uniref:GbsR/MarR family transcriptional regulator n=1 Tax=Bailinhaonella thermotolerans TaxID=1070861 RepID=UPI00192A2336|nr:helix-turn-helix domain-containing protein [Bailinhaonella thermotolerans]